VVCEVRGSGQEARAPHLVLLFDVHCRGSEGDNSSRRVYQCESPGTAAALAAGATAAA
jgi:hypothetical protein